MTPKRLLIWENRGTFLTFEFAHVNFLVRVQQGIRDRTCGRLYILIGVLDSRAFRESPHVAPSLALSRRFCRLCCSFVGYQDEFSNVSGDCLCEKTRGTFLTFERLQAKVIFLRQCGVALFFIMKYFCRDCSPPPDESNFGHLPSDQNLHNVDCDSSLRCMESLLRILSLRASFHRVLSFCLVFWQESVFEGNLQVQFDLIYTAGGIVSSIDFHLFENDARPVIAWSLETVNLAVSAYM